MGNDVKEVTTGEVRLSYVNLFQPRQTDYGPKYSVTILLPKSDIATKQRIDLAIQAAKQEGTAKKWSGVCPPNVPIPIHDGDGVKTDGTPYSAECKGHWVFSAAQQAEKGRVEIVDANLNPIINQSEVYSGMYGRVCVRFSPYFTSGKKGIGCYLGPVQKLRDGEPLAGATASAAEAFGAPAAQPQQYVAQPQQYVAQPQQYVAQPQQYVAQPQVIDPITGQPVQPPVMGL